MFGEYKEMILTEICGLKEIEYYNGCSSCNGLDKTKLCYTSLDDLKQHLTDFRNLFHPQVQRFYQRYGYDYLKKIGIKQWNNQKWIG